jgi:murein DD-endopeptidase MepM/ murein hydrolase activator NlpD
MSQKSRFFAIFLAAFLLLGATAPASAAVWPFGKLLHLHPSATQVQDARITVEIYNRSGLVQQIKVSGRVYTMLPHDGLAIKAPEGTEVFAASDGFKHRKGDLLFAITAKLNLDTVTLD